MIPTLLNRTIIRRTRIAPRRSYATKVDVAIVGGGIVGLATGREIQNRFPNKSIVILEKESDIGQHQSSHNSGVIHAGMYYKPGSTMARCCVQGAKMMYKYCDEKGIPYERVGKLIVATSPDEVEAVHELYRRGVQNGVEGLEVLNSQQIKELEPNVTAYAALNSPNTGIIDYFVVCQSLANDIKSKNGQIKTNFLAQKFTLTPEKQVMIESDNHEAVITNYVITCCGLHSDKVAIAAGGDKKPRVLPFRGSYYEMKDEFRNIVKRNIYPVPNNKAGIPTGIHFTPTMRGQMIIGPGACLAFHKEGYKFTDFRLKDFINIVTNLSLWKLFLRHPRLSLHEIYKDLSASAFLREAQKMVPSLKFENTKRSFAGVMAQVFDDNGNNATDFIFESNVLEGTTLNVRNAPSPACTSSLALAGEIVNRASMDFKWN